MEDRKRWQIPEFGNWDYCDEMPITQYFESARQAGLVRCGFFGPACEEDDLFKVPVAVPVKSVYRDGSYHRKARRASISSSGGEEKSYSKEQKLRKQGKVAGEVVALPPRRPKAAPKAVDEDLYKIPPELLYQKPKRKKQLSNLLSGCLGLSCVA